MELKEYQQKSLNQIKSYLEALAQWQIRNQVIVEEHGAEVVIDFPLKAWEELGVIHSYHSRRNGLGKEFPSFCIKIPTGGGKTLLAVKTIDLINDIYLRKRNGLVLWVVPTTQIYRQTIQNLRDKDHPYRQFLDIASGGRTLIVEKTDRFTPLDVAENLVVLMLMLPSAARQSRETLRVFRDNGGFQEFFPPEDDIEGHKNLLEKVPNLDTFGNGNGFWWRQIKTSLGNTLRLLSPLIILDEGHRAYSETAQSTLRGFNPSILVELSATPPQGSNILVDIPGIDLDREEMIKLDLHITNKASPDWKDTLLASVNHRNTLEQKAREYEANTGIYIRPICLIQVERTGREQRGGRYIHSEDVREHLINVVGIPPEEIAVKTSERDELKEVDDVGGLMSRDAKIRYIITKQALQEGWDCPFAYVLTILTNPTSRTALTQLVGRILRQPYAKETGAIELDESYVFCFQQRGAQLLEEIRRGFGLEGLGDLAANVITEEGFEEGAQGSERVYGVRPKLQDVTKKVILPFFIINSEGGWRRVNYEIDIASRIPWSEVDLRSLYPLALSRTEDKDIEHIATLSEDIRELVRQKRVVRLKEGGIKLDSVFLARHLLDIVPNPWIAFEFGERVLSALLKKHDANLVINNFVFIIEELRKHLASEKNRLAQALFLELLAKDVIRFMVVGKDLGYRLPQRREVNTLSRTLTKANGEPLQESLFEFVPEEEFNDVEKTVAWYLEEHEKLFFWYRNRAKQDYALQGWRKHKVYADFIFSSKDGSTEELDKIFVIDTKGLHIKDSEDTDYKRSLFDICNQEAEKKTTTELGLVLQNKRLQFEVIAEDEWRRKLNEMLS